MSDRPFPDHVYLDTGVVVAALFEGSLNAVAGAAFCDQLGTNRSTDYFSSILRVELSEVVRKLATIPGRVPEHVRRQYRLDDWERDRTVRREWLDAGVREFELLLGSFVEYYELPFRRSIWLRSVEIMADRQLRSHDAIHLATAYETRLRTFVTTDDEFLKIPDLDIRLIRDPVT